MSETGNLVIASTSRTAFRASGEAAQMRLWLREARWDMSSDACRQVVHYAGTFIEVFGTEAPALIKQPPERIRARLDDATEAADGVHHNLHRHLLRAGKAMHAAVYDLDRETTRMLMDRRTPRAEPAKYARQTAERQTNDIPAATSDRADPVTPSPLPETVQPVIEAVNYQLTAQLQLDDTVDVRAAAQSVLGTLSPAARVQIAAVLPDAAQLPVEISPEASASTVVDLAEEAIIALLEQRYADLRVV